jgi:hypothetical protein
VAVWVYPGDVSAKQAILAFDGNTTDGNGSGFRLLVTGGQFCVDNNSSPSLVCVSAGSAGQWSLIVATISGNIWTLYRYTQGSSTAPATSATSTSTATFATSGVWRAGASYISSSNKPWGFYGSIDEVHLWSRALNETEADCLSAVNTPACMWITNSSATQWSTQTVTGSVTAYSTKTVTGNQTGYSTQTVSGTQTGYSTQTMSGTQTGYSTKTLTGTGTAYTTGYVSSTTTATGTSIQTVTQPGTWSHAVSTTNTQVVSGSYTLTATAISTSLAYPVPDLDDCTSTSCLWPGANGSRCYLSSSTQCSSNSSCTINGDFCQYIDTNDGTGRGKNDFCVLPDPNPTGKTNCRYQTNTTNCSNNSNCDSGVGDYCVSGTPANMCQKTGLWCADDGSGCDPYNGNPCVPATSRLMMVKNAVRRIMLEHAYDDTAVVKMGQMHTFQAGWTGDPNNPTLDPTKLFPYVKLDDTHYSVATRTEVKFLPRSELLKGSCFSASTGPSSTCTIDYGGGGAVGTPAVTYTLKTGGNSRYAVPTGDGQTYTRYTADWASSCGVLCPFAGGNGVYEGSYYNFSYTWGVPVLGSHSDAAQTGTLFAPKFYTTYQGKSFGSAGNYWYLMDAERSEFVNENKYGAREFAGSTWSTSVEYPVPLAGAGGDPTSTAVTCSASNGAQWDHNVVPMANDTTFGSNSSLKPTQKALMNAARLEKASYGGFYATGHIEPVACALKNDGSNDEQHSVDGYMSLVKSRDGSACWEDHVLLVVDGLPRGPGDVAVGGVDCSASTCVYDPNSNPTLAGCNCPAVIKARALASGGVNVHVIAASTDLTSRNSYAAATLNNIARAGSTRTTFINIPRYAASEDELYYWLNYEMKEALRVTVATTPASAANGIQSLEGVTAGNTLFQTTVELPEWRGDLVAFSIGTQTDPNTPYTTAAAWSAATKNIFKVVPGSPPSAADQQLWMQRNVFFSDGSGHVQQIKVNGDGTIDSGTENALFGLGMGEDPNEAGRIVQWMLGKIDPNDPDHKPLNPAVMGSVLNSMPIDVGPPGPNSMPGGNHFWYAHANRPELVYLGSDDGMLHAFYAVDCAEGAAGMEAFAFVPRDMIPVIAKLYAQGGQRYSPNDHVWGLAGSPKVKNLCIQHCSVTGSSCSDQPYSTYDDSVCPTWKTVLIMSEGPGGNHPFALDITDPFASGSAALTDASLLWHVPYKGAAGISISDLGETDSVPAFTYRQTVDQNDYRVVMASGYPYPSGSSTTTKLVEATAWAGDTPSTTAGATISGSGSCTGTTGQEFAVLADVAVARDYTKNGNQNMLAGYVADTWGTVHQYAPAYSPVLHDIITVGCQHPLHFSPAVVQLNRNDQSLTADTSIFLAQVSNSILDPITVAYSASTFPASKLVVAKLTTIGNNPPALDPTFGTSGLIQLSADASSAANRLCGVATTIKTSVATDCGSGGSWLPNNARPTGTPVAVLLTGGSGYQGFQLFTTWYTPPAANWDNCPGSSTNGNSYITVHEFHADGTWAQIRGLSIQHQYVTGVQFVGTTLFITGGDGTNPQAPPTFNLGQTFSIASPQGLGGTAGERFVRTDWTERLDVD